MKIPNKRELQQFVFNHSSDIEFQDSMNLYKSVLKNHILFWLLILLLHSLRFIKNLLERILKLIMTIDEKVKDGKLQYNINREEAKMLALSSGKIDKYEYLTGEEILPSDQSIIIEQAKFTYSPLRNAFEKPIKTIEEHEKTS